MPAVSRPAVAWDSSAAVRRGQAALVWIGVLALLPAVGGTVLRVARPVDDGLALLASFVPYALVGYLLAAGCLIVAAIRARAQRPARRVLAALAVLASSGLAYHVATVAPLFGPDRQPPGTSPFTLVSLNLRHGAADADELTAVTGGADVVVLVESTPPAIAALDARGWRERLPYVVGATTSGDNGSVVYSRFPLSDSEQLPASSFEQWVTTVQVPDVGPVRLFAVHPCNPFCGGGAFGREHAGLREVVRAERSLPVVVAGDFNAVDDHGPMQDLRSDGLRSATGLAGAGWLPTYPANGLVPPLLPIDHVLLSRDLTATAVETVRISGTDHLALRTEVAGFSR